MRPFRFVARMLYMDEDRNNTNPIQMIQHDHSHSIPFEWALKKLFEPILNELGQDMVSIKRRIGKVVVSAMEKLRPDQETSKTNARVAWNVISEASFIESEIGAEYFGGILAAAKTGDGTDDTGIYYLQIAKSLSSKQLYLHYIFYKSLNSLFLEDESNRTLNLGMGSELGQKTVYFLASELINLGVNIETDFHALSANNLIGQGWSVQQETLKDKTSEIEQEICRASFVPSTLGIQFMAIAENRLNEYRSFTYASFGLLANIEIPKYSAFSLDDLLTKAKRDLS